MPPMRYLLPLFLIIVLMLVPVVTFGQNGQNQQQLKLSYGKYQVIKTSNNERFVFPYTASNNDRLNPLVYTFDKSKGPSWILTIQNNMSYAYRQDAKTIIKLQEPAPSEKFIEITMYSDAASKRFLAAVNTKESGYVRLYDKNGFSGWSRNQPILVGYDNNQGLSINSGIRTIVDRLSVNGFILGSIAVYGKDDPQSPLNTYAGNISFDVISGKPGDSPIYYLPLGMLVGVGGLVGGLLVLKKRKISSE